jgi:hypothetical protein
MTIERRLKAGASTPSMHERVEECTGIIVDGPQTFERRPLALHASCFRKPMLSEISILVPDADFLSDKGSGTFPLSLHQVACA